MNVSEIKQQNGYVGYLLSNESRRNLLNIFPPKFSKVIAHHVTTEFGVTADSIPDPVKMARVVGHASNGSIQALVIEIDGATKRTDGSTYHITWSLDPASGSKPKDSNVLLANGYEQVTQYAIKLTPKFFTF
jgi:hypothetical protein